MQRPPPFRIVIGNVQGIRRAPRAAQFAVGMTLRSQFSPVWMTRHGRISAVQTHGVAILVYQLDALYAVRAARRTPDFVHELESTRVLTSGVRLKRGSTPRCSTAKAFMCRAHENRHAQRPAQIRYCNRVCTPAMSPTRTRRLPSCS